MMMLSGATAQTGPWPPLRVSWLLCGTMWGYQLHDRPVLDTLFQPTETSSSHYQRLSWRSRETRVRNGRWILPTSTYRARRVLLHAVNLRHRNDGFTSSPKEGVLRILSPLKSIVLGQVKIFKYTRKCSHIRLLVKVESYTFSTCLPN
jgi:hypothetical protein